MYSQRTSASSLTEQFPELVNHLGGNLALTISAPASQDQPKPQGLVYATSLKGWELWRSAEISCLVVPQKLGPSVLARVGANAAVPFCILGTTDVQLAMAKINFKFFPEHPDAFSTNDNLIHPTAVLGRNVRLGAGVQIGPYAVLEDDVEIGDHSSIGAQSFLGQKSSVGHNSDIGTQVYLAARTQIGNSCRILSQTVIGSTGFGFARDSEGRLHHKPHYGKVIVQDHCFLGANVNIARGVFEDTIIGCGTKIDNHVQIAHNCVIGDHNVIAAGLKMAGSSRIGSFNTIGGSCSINGHASLGDQNLVAGLTAISGRRPFSKQVLGGYPVQDAASHRRSLMCARELPEWRKALLSIIKHLGLSDQIKLSRRQSMDHVDSD